MKKIALIILSVIILFVLIFCITRCAKNEGIESNNTTTDTSKNKVATDSYEASVYYDKDHYVLNVFTSNITEKFSFTYNGEDFLIDATGKVFSKAWKQVDDQVIKYTFDLESNTLYEFKFIPLTGKELQLGKNLVIK